MADVIVLKSEPRTDKEISAMVIDRWKICQQQQKDDFEDKRDLLKKYDMELDYITDSEGNPKYPYRSHVFSPMVFQIVETEVPRIIASIFSNEPYFSVRPRYHRWIANWRNVECLCNSQLTKVNVVGEMIKAIKMAVKLGKVVIKQRWNYQKSEIDAREPVYFPETQFVVGYKHVQETMVVNNEPTFEIVPWDAFFIDPKALTIKTSLYCIEEMIKDAKYLEDILDAEDKVNFKIGNIKKFLKTITKGGNIKRSEDQLAYQSDPYRREFRLLRYEEDNRFILIAMPDEGSGTVIQDIKNPFYHREKSYTEINVNANELGFWNKGDIHPIKDLQDAINTTINQRFDNVSIGLNGRYLVDENANTDLEALARSIPGGIIRTGDVTDRAVKQLDVIDFFGRAFADQTGLLDRMAQDASGVTDYLSGKSRPSMTKTATGMIQMTENANSRFDLKIRTIAAVNGGLNEFMRKWHALNQQFLDPDIEVTVQNPNAPGGYETTIMQPEDIMGDYDFLLSDFGLSNRNLRIQQLTALVPPELLAQFYNLPEIAKRVIELLGIREAEQLVTQQPNPAMMQGQGGSLAKSPLAPRSESDASLEMMAQRQGVF